MPRRSYARGSRAWGQDARTGDRHLLRDLVPDGQTRGLPVHPTAFEPRHPQEGVPDVYDPVILANPAPDQDRPVIQVNLPTVDDLTLDPLPAISAAAVLGKITSEIV